MFADAGLVCEEVGHFRIHQDFQPWVERIGTPEGCVTGLRALFESVPDEVRAHFGIRGDGDHAFALDLAVLGGAGAKPAPH